MRSFLLLPFTVLCIFSAVDSAVVKKKEHSAEALQTPQTRKFKNGKDTSARPPVAESTFVETTVFHEGTSKRKHGKHHKHNDENRSNLPSNRDEDPHISQGEDSDQQGELGEILQEEQSSIIEHNNNMASLDESDPQMARKLRIEMIKQQILDKLRLDAPPNITRGRVRLPEPLAFSERSLGMQSDQPPEVQEDDYYGKLTEAIIFAEEVDNFCESKSSSTCFRFPLQSEVHDKSISSAQLYFYRVASPNDEDDQTLSVMQLGHQGLKPIGEVRTSNREGWVQMEIKETVARWLIHDVDNRELMVHCKTCQSQNSPISLTGSKRPFLFIKTDTPTSRRTTRSIYCKPGIKQCCRQDFYISFAEIEWDDWIIQPVGYDANFCKGSCTQGTSPLSHHTSIIYSVAMKEKDKEIRDLLTPCCVPSSFLPLEIVYHTDDDSIYRRSIPNMTAQSCRCG
ncbi:growth/differentiation factor 8-like [Anneissia japonica]|uniref:growth/differentiation factor 8-like n=1 Tax=Anneissia japonica TaxID=1529436 RepID=UPI0014258EB7|nr:growth/differentiation factor 8-like [Anneissia japonica]